MEEDRRNPKRRSPIVIGAMKPTALVRFVQWESFVRDWNDLGLADDDLRALEMAIRADPKAAPVVVGTNGLRKMRFAPPRWRTGKRGALRIGYIAFESHALVLLLVAYSKDEQANLTAGEKKMVKSLIDEVQQALDDASIR